MDSSDPLKDNGDHAHPSYGINAKRGCTDMVCLLVFAAFWALMFFVASVVFEQGDPNRILYGIDMLGNNCGHEMKRNVTDLGADPWVTRRNIWYPLQFNPVSASASVDSALSIGVCVNTCPKAGTVIQGYAEVGTPFYRIPYYVVLYDSFPVLHRCLPNVSSVICNSLTGCEDTATTLAPGPTAAPTTTTTTTTTTTSAPTTTQSPNTTTAVPNASTTTTTTTTTTAAPTTTQSPTTSTPAPTTTPAPNAHLAIGGIAAFRNMANDSIEELLRYWWVVLVGMLIATLLSFAWLFVLRRTVKPLVVITALLLLAVLVLGGGLCFMMRNDTLDDVQSDEDTPKYWLTGAIAFWIVSFLFLCVMIFLFRDVMTACDIIEEASKVPVKIPTMTLVPLVCFLLILPFVVWTMFVAIYIQSCGDTITFTAPNVTIPGVDAATMHNMTASAVELQNWRMPAHLYNLFMFLWTFGVCNAICFMILSMCAVFWYFSNPGDDKNPPLGSVCLAACIVVKNHLGTIFVGAFIVALIQIIRVMLLIVEKKMSETLKKNDAVRGLMACLHCVMACLERAMKFINKNAYIMTAIEGTNFIASAQRALSLLVGNALTVGAITIISEYVMIFGKILITGVATLIAFAILKTQKGDDALRSGVLILACSALVAFFIASLFINVFSVCIDTILLCYCVDKEDTSSAQHYFPTDLAAHVAKQAKKMAVSNGDAVNKEEPLLPSPPQRNVQLTAQDLL